MKKAKVYIIDTIGAHSGMHYYLDAFQTVLNKSPDVEVIVLSNCGEGVSSFFPMIYTGGKLSKAMKLAFSYRKLRRFLRKYSNDHFVYLSYGRSLDRLFIRLFQKNAPHFVVDVHDVFDIRGRLSDKDRKALEDCYRKVPNFIVHSEKSAAILKKIAPDKKQFFVPHFPYCLDQVSSIEPPNDEMASALHTDRKNILFFGHIRKSKGIDQFFKLMNKLSPAQKDQVHVIVAGNDSDNVIQTMGLKFNELSNRLLLRHITDAELAFLFSQSAVVVLPYREISQSGVLEMAIQFHTPVLTSDLPAFQEYLQHYPSFGQTFPIDDHDAFHRALFSLLSVGSSHYLQEDCERYMERDDFQQFSNEIQRDFLRIIP